MELKWDNKSLITLDKPPTYPYNSFIKNIIIKKLNTL